MAGDGGRAPDVSEQRAEVEAVGEAMDAWLFAVHGKVSSLRASEVGAADVIAAYLSNADPASVLAALLAEQPDAIVAAIEALLTRDEAVDALVWASPYGLQRHTARQMQESACRSLRPKAPKEDRDA